MLKPAMVLSLKDGIRSNFKWPSRVQFWSGMVSDSQLGFSAKRVNLFAKISHFLRKTNFGRKCRIFRISYVCEKCKNFGGKGGNVKILRKCTEEKFFAKIIKRSIHFFAKNAKSREKVCEIRPNFFAFFGESFCSLETLLSYNNKILFFFLTISFVVFAAWIRK